MSKTTDAFAEWASQPFSPNHLEENGRAADVGERIAVSLEYIAAQLGEICRKMDHLGAASETARDDFERMNELLRRL